MKIIKLFGNTAGLMLAMAFILIFLSGRATLFSTVDSFLFDIGARFLANRETPDNITLVTLPVSRADELTRDPDLTSEFIQFLEKLKDVKPRSTVFILDGYPQAVINSRLIQVEKRLEQVAVSTDSTDSSEIADILTYVQNFSEPGAHLAGSLQENDVLVAMKIDARTSVWHTFGSDITPYQTMAAEEPGKQTFWERLPATTWFYDMPAIDGNEGRGGEEDSYGKVVPLFSGGADVRGWPLVWKYGDGFMPDLVTLLYQKNTSSADPLWVDKKGVLFDYYLMHTDFSGRLRPLFLTSGRRNLDIETFPIAGMAFDKNLNSLKNKIVLIGSDKDPALKSTALALASMGKEATAHTPVWAIWLDMGMILLFAAYLVFLLQRLQVWLGTVLSVLLIFLSLAVQWGVLMTKGVWLPITIAMVYLIAGHILMQFRFHTRGQFLKLETKKHDAFYTLGTYYSENRRFDKAFEAFKECIPSNMVLDSLYDLGLEYERRQKLKKACGVFEYIDSRRKDFRGAGKRADQLNDFLEGRVGGDDNSNGTETVSMPAFELQRTILGRYEIERELGRGAMGIVYLGRDPKIGRRVAIKTLDLAESENQDTDHEAVKNRFFREAEAIGRLNHPNIVTVYDVGEEDDLAFIAMDFLTGKSLMFYTDNNNLLPVPIVYDITIQVAEALAYAHDQNVIHRDIKPGNIIYNEKDGLVKVTDFGIARLIDTSLTSTHTILGSPSFMAPEQLKGSRVDGRADIFSLGVTFFQLLTGQFPFGGNDLATITYQIANAETPDVNQFRAGLPKSAGAIVYKALEKEPDQRYQTAAEMAEALRKNAPKGTGGRKKK